MLLVLIAFLAVVVAGPLFGSDRRRGRSATGFLKARDRLHPLADRRAGAARRPSPLLYSLAPKKGPQRGTRSLRSVLPGAVFGVLLWFAVSLVFTLYVAHFGAYDKTYGTLGALISLLVWLWLGNLAFLLGALFNAESHRVRGGGR